MKLACAAAPPCEVQGDREVAPSGARGKEAHSRRGKRATAPKGVGVQETAGDKASLGSSGGLVDNCKGASGLERGQRDLREGNTLKKVA